MTPARERNIPPATSPLVSPPPLTPKVGPLRVGGRQGSPDDHDQEQEGQAPDPQPGRSRGGRRRPPRAQGAVPTTVRFDQEEATEVDQFVLELRAHADRRTLDKAEVIRELLRLAREHEPTRRALLRRLR